MSDEESQPAPVQTFAENGLTRMMLLMLLLLLRIMVDVDADVEADEYRHARELRSASLQALNLAPRDTKPAQTRGKFSRENYNEPRRQKRKERREERRKGRRKGPLRNLM